MPKSDFLERARRLRVEQTEFESKLWSVLRDRRLGGWKWKRQVPRGRYILDFYCAEAGLVVELDGSQHLEPRAQAYDARRTAGLKADGLTVLRLFNADVLENMEGVAEAILEACRNGALSPSPREAGRGLGEGRSAAKPVSAAAKPS